MGVFTGLCICEVKYSAVVEILTPTLSPSSYLLYINGGSRHCFFFCRKNIHDLFLFASDSRK